MEELRFVRREDRSLIVSTEAGSEFRFIVDDSVLSELKHLSRQNRDTSKVRPREIQSLIRAGKTRAEVAEVTGLEEVDIERYEEPVLAERRYILERAHAVAVRTSTVGDEQERFGTVIAERLIGLSAEKNEWSSWRDEEAGWMIAVDFTSHDVDHRAVWSFEHRKGVLAPRTPDAVTLSKQGDPGDRLIPKLRAVDNGDRAERFDSDAFDAEQLREATEDAQDSEAETTGEPGSPATESDAPEQEPVDQNAEYARRREIDQRAISTTRAEDGDLGHTADLLDALRKRRGARELSQQLPLDIDGDGALDDGESGDDDSVDDKTVLVVRDERAARAEAETRDSSPASSSSRFAPVGEQGDPAPAAVSHPAFMRAAQNETDSADGAAGRAKNGKTSAPEGEKNGRKRRTSIPSWDDILFGTRSEDDPARD